MKKVIRDIFLKLIFNINYGKSNELHNDLPFLPEIAKIEKVEKVVDNLHDKNEHVIHISKLKQVSIYRLVLRKVHGVIKFNQLRNFKRK